MSKYSLGSLVHFKGMEYEVVGEYYPYKEWNSTSKAKHLLLKSTNRAFYSGWRHQFFTQNATFYDTTIFVPQAGFGNQLVRSSINLISCSNNSKFVKPIGTQYDPKQQPWEEGDI